jgi:hypothetical protein
MNTDPGAICRHGEIAVKEIVMDQYAFYASHISRENIDKKVKRPRGPRSSSGLGRQNKNTFFKL